MLRKDGVTVVAVDSTEPDLDHGQIGRGRYPWIEEQFTEEPSDLRIFVLHHHLLPVPGTGRERNVVYDAGDAIECLLRAGVHLVLSGHKHVPYAWRLENLFVVNTGTVSSLRLRGNTRPCYNVIEVNGTHVSISRRHPFHGEERIIQFSTGDVRVREVHGPDRAGGDDPEVRRVVAIVDGEHYPPVVRAALEELDDLVVAAVLVGGTEKLRGDEVDYGVPLEPSLEEAVERHAPDVVLDLSDEPVLGPAGALRARRAASSRSGSRTRGRTSASIRRRSCTVDAADARGDRHGQACREDGRHRLPRAPARRVEAGRRRRDGARRPA